MKNVFKEFYRKIIMYLPVKIVMHIETLRGYQKLCNYNDPKYFGEKVQWLKLNGNLEKYTDYVDKYKVRDHVKEKIGNEYLIDLIHVYDKPDEIDFNSLPNRFVIKLNTGSGFNIVVSDKKMFDKEKAIRKLEKWLKIDYFRIKKEPQYKFIDKKIIIEKYICDKNGYLNDYKFFCFDGKVELIEVDCDRFGNHTMNFYDKEWNLLNLTKGKLKNNNEIINKPTNLQKMIEIAEILSKDFQFVRVDLYNVDGKIYFGELTFTPAGGLTRFNPISEDIRLASKIKISSKRNILLAASTSKRKNRLDGVTIKSRVLEEFLMEQDDLRVFSVDTDNYKNYFLSISFELIKGIKKCEKIVICSSSPGAAKLLKFLKLIKCKKEIYYFVAGGIIGDKIKNQTYDIRNYESLAQIYVESKSLKVQLEELGLKNVSQLNNFRYIGEFTQNNNLSDDFKFVFWARVNQNKGVEDCIRVIKEINKNTKMHATLDIYGQCTETYLKKINTLLDEDIRYLGPITPNNKAEYEILSGYDVLLFPTKYYNEGLPGTLIDAYISSLAVVVSDWKYSREYVEDQTNGLIFKFNDYNDFYKSVLKIMDKNIITKYKENSKQISKNYDIRYVLDEFIEKLR